MLQYSEYEKIIKKGKRVDWYETEVPEALITPSVIYSANQIVEQINKYEGVDAKKNKDYIEALWANVRRLPYTLNGDCYLLKKKEIENGMIKKPKKERTTEQIQKDKEKMAQLRSKRKTKINAVKP
jgi:hypothetical protein